MKINRLNKPVEILTQLFEFSGQLGKKWSSKGKMFDSRQSILKSDDTNEFGHGLLHKAVIHNNVQDFRK